jgi:ABC-type branched-subunit amino acid transport system ATPase component
MTGPLLDVAGLSKSFGGLVAVDSLDLAVAPGEILGLIGPNGSGKTTVLDTISGRLKANAGRIVFKAHDITRAPPHRIARLGIARTFQLIRPLGDMTCAENVRVGLAFGAAPLWGEAAARTASELLARVGLEGRERVTADQLTYIDLKRLELARALALSPDLLLLDEWLAGLTHGELQAGIALVRSLAGEGRTVIMVEHVMDAIRSLTDRCIVMSAGKKIADGKAAEVLLDREVVRAYLGEEDA